MPFLACANGVTASTARSRLGATRRPLGRDASQADGYGRQNASSHIRRVAGQTFGHELEHKRLHVCRTLTGAIEAERPTTDGVDEVARSRVVPERRSSGWPQPTGFSKGPYRPM